MKNILKLAPLAVLLVLFAAPSAFASPPVPTDQMLSSSYNNVNINSFQSGLGTVETISFSVSAVAKLEVTSINEINTTSGAECNATLDTTVLYDMTHTSNAGGIADFTVTNSNVSSGSHTLTIACDTGNTVVTSNDQGSVSLIVTTGL